MAHTSPLYLHRFATTKRLLLYVESPDGRWLTHLFSISAGSLLPRGRYFMWSPQMVHTSLRYLHRLATIPRGRYFTWRLPMVHTSPLSDVSHLHRLAITKRQDRCFLCAFSKARKNHLSTQKTCLLSSPTC